MTETNNIFQNFYLGHKDTETLQQSLEVKLQW